MKNISIFDTSISDYNLGNQIIMDSIYKNLNESFPGDFFFKIPTMEITRHTVKYIKRSDLVFFGGTNSLNARMERYRQWGINLFNCWSIKNVILMGIGWWQYEGNITLYTKFILKKILSKKGIHSVRDSYTEAKLRSIGFSNVINTGCPTLWSLTNEHCIEIPKCKSKNVIFTLTDYSKDIKRDKHIISTLLSNYNNVYIWIQGDGDLEYFKSICNDKNIKIINPKLDEYNRFLIDNDIDYVGTRLHAGVRALQLKKRTIIIGIDNRALEMNKDFNLPVLSKDNIDSLEEMINSDFSTLIKIPEENIIIWKKQFFKK